MAGTEVLTSRLLEVAKALEDIIARYNQSVNKMYTIGGEIDNMWDGEAGDKFMTKMGNDRERFDALTKLLQQYVEVLRQDAAIYDKAEAEVLNIISTKKN